MPPAGARMHQVGTPPGRDGDQPPPRRSRSDPVGRIGGQVIRVHVHRRKATAFAEGKLCYHRRTDNLLLAATAPRDARKSESPSPPRILAARVPHLGTSVGTFSSSPDTRLRGLPFHRQPVLCRELSLELPGFEPEPVPGFEAAPTGNWGGRYWEPGRIPPGMAAEIVGQVGDLTDEFRP